MQLKQNPFIILCLDRSRVGKRFFFVFLKSPVVLAFFNQVNSVSLLSVVAACWQVVKEIMRQVEIKKEDLFKY